MRIGVEAEDFAPILGYGLLEIARLLVFQVEEHLGGHIAIRASLMVNTHARYIEIVCDSIEACSLKRGIEASNEAL